MIKKLVRHGNSLALIIDKPILELLGIDEDGEVELSLEGKTLQILAPEVANHRRRVAESLARVNERHGGALKRLAE